MHPRCSWNNMNRYWTAFKESTPVAYVSSLNLLEQWFTDDMEKTLIRIALATYNKIRHKQNHPQAINNNLFGLADAKSEWNTKLS